MVTDSPPICNARRVAWVFLPRIRIDLVSAQLMPQKRYLVVFRAAGVDKAGHDLGASAAALPRACWETWDRCRLGLPWHFGSATSRQRALRPARDGCGPLSSATSFRICEISGPGWPTLFRTVRRARRGTPNRASRDAPASAPAVSSRRNEPP